MNAPDPLIGQNVGGYVVEQPLGEGGMGLVYRARHPILNRSFAVKVLRPEVAADASVSANFIREAQVLSGLKHPHIIDIVGFGTLENDGRQYMVMEFLEGKTLGDELDAHGKLDVPRALTLADQILDALAAAHSVDVVHRDLKPTNVFLAKVSGGRELVKLLDFGLAKAIPQAMGADAPAVQGHSVVAGTPEYVAPEQALGKPASRYSDLYSFGVVLYEMLTGTLPYDATGADRVRDLILKKLNREAPSIAASAEPFAFPYELEVAVADLLKPDAADRPSSADTVRSRLARVNRTLQSHATQQRPNPLLAPTEAMLAAAKEQRVALERIAPTRGETAQLYGPFTEKPPRSRATWAVALLPLLLLLTGGWWSMRARPAEPRAVPPVEAIPEEATPVAAIADAAEPPASSTVMGEPDLLTSLEHRAPPRRAQKAPGNHGVRVSIHEPEAPEAERANVAILRAQCEPNDRWRQAARAHMQELQAAAAQKDDPAAWKKFEAAEARLAAAITTAQSGVECEAVDREIAQLAGRFTP